MSLILAGMPYIFNGVTITPMQPVLEDKADDILEIEKRENHVIITFPENMQRRWEATIFSRLPLKPSLSPFRFRGRLCFFLNNTTFYGEDKVPITNLENGTYRGKVHFCFPSVNEKDGNTSLKIKLLSILLSKKPCPWWIQVVCFIIVYLLFIKWLFTIVSLHHNKQNGDSNVCDDVHGVDLHSRSYIDHK